ncbi:hypothetical protein BT93_H3533 [Corymbia citriodora subsp. variegata]|nr:hypothetical protein BT93_H3533 [Corymbia citriodora subsp. variegata]
MEFDDVKSDLYALRKLYELLQQSADGPHHGDAIYLDQRAQVLFKDLLDYATEGIFRTFRQIVSAQSITRGSSSSPQPLHFTSASESLGLPDRPWTSSGVIDVLRDPILHDTTPKNDECLPAKCTPNKLVPEPSKLSILSTNQGSQRKQCRVCRRSIMKQRISGRELEVSANSVARTVVGQERIDFGGAEAKPRNSLENSGDGSSTSKQEPQSHKRVLDFEHQARIAAPVTISTSSLAFAHRKPRGSYINKSGHEIIKQPDGASDFTKDLTEAIKKIEARIYVLQLYSQNEELITKLTSQSGMDKAVGAIRPVMEPNEQKFTGRMLEHGAYVTNGLPLQAWSQNRYSQENLSQAGQLPSEKPKHGASNTSHQTGVLLREAGQNQSWNLTAESYRDLLSQTSLRNECQGRKSGKCDNLKQKKTMISPQNVKAMVEKPETMSQSLNRNTHAISVKNNMVHGLVVPPSFANVPKKPPLPVSQKQMARENSAVKLANSRLLIPPKSSGSIGSVSSSNRFRSKSPMPLHVTLKPTLMDRFSSKKKAPMRRQAQMVPKKTSVRTRNKMVSPQRESDCSSLSSRSSYISRTSEETCTSSSDSKASADTEFSTGSGRTTEESSSSYSVSTHNGQVEVDSSHTLDRRRGSISSHPTNREKGVGRLRRMKNKLGLIFHHHHHHHHHHHQGYSDDRDDKLQRRPTTSVWKQVRGMFHRRNTRDVNKATKSGKHQVGRFHALVEGFLRHRQHTKNSKASRGNGIRVHKKKKSRWWPKFRHRGGMKLKNRGRAKLKLPGKRPRMKALKMH